MTRVVSIKNSLLIINGRTSNKKRKTSACSTVATSGGRARVVDGAFEGKNSNGATIIVFFRAGIFKGKPEISLIFIDFFAFFFEAGAPFAAFRRIRRAKGGKRGVLRGLVDLRKVCILYWLGGAEPSPSNFGARREDGRTRK